MAKSGRVLSIDITNEYAPEHLILAVSDYTEMAEKVVTRLPLIPEYNTPDDVAKSRALLEQMGVKHFDEFEYMVNRKG